MNFGSVLFSIFVHALVAAVIWLWPSSPPIQLDREVIQISLTMGAPGGDKLPSPVLGHLGSPAPAKPAAEPVLNTPAAARQSAEALPDATRLEKLEAKAEALADPERAVQAKPAPAKTPPPAKPEKKPAPEKDAVALNSQQKARKDKESEKKPKPETKPDKNAQEKAKPQAEKKDAKQEKKGDDKPKEKQPSSEDVLKSALADARRAEAKNRRGSGSSAVANALAQAKREARGTGGGGGGEGDGPGGGGLYDVYAGMVVMAVRPNWSMPTYSRDPLVAYVRVKLDPAGQVLDASLERSSGRADFDASAVNAVRRTQTLPKPPTPAQQEIVIAFNSLELMGR
ncbi:MAG TPA: cell envelope integrity protein TolA [Candidatus Avidesulfovibrio excrementigallinarum]|nr:cell envelope integrity protein TolA [Candidatus Avidesulfovibrio excrementigallinarum]